MQPVLYSFRRCPYAMRARLALRYSGIRCELREVALRDKPAEMLELSPKGTVPVLVVSSVTGGHDVIDESLDIMFWALAQSDPDGWLSVDLNDADTLLAGNDDDFKIWLDRYKYPDRYSDDGDSNARDECGRFLDELEARLSTRAWLAAAHMSVVDIAIFPFIRQFAHTDLAWFRSGAYPQLSRWLDDLLGQPLFAAIMTKYPVWQSGEEGIQF